MLTRRASEGATLIDKSTGRVLGRVSVVIVDGLKVRLGFEFSRDTEIWRDELLVAPATHPSGPEAQVRQ